MTDFKVGDRVRIKAGMWRRKNSFLMHGQEIVLTEDDRLDRGDLDLVFELIEPEPESESAGGVEVDETDADDEEDEGGEVDYDQETLDTLIDRLDAMNVDQAKRYLSGDDWDVEIMELARVAEEQTRNRSSILDFIDGRLAQLRILAGDED